MKLAGTHSFPASRQQVWEFLNDPERLARVLPGCEALEPVGPDRYKAKIKFVLASFSGAYTGGVELSEKKPPESMRMRVEGKGGPGFMKGEGGLSAASTKGFRPMPGDAAGSRRASARRRRARTAGGWRR